MHDVFGTQIQLQIQQRILADMHALIEPQPVFKQFAHVELIPQVVINAVHVDDLPNDFRRLRYDRLDFHRHTAAPFHIKERVVGRGDLCAAFHCRLIQNRQRVLLQHIISIHERNIPPRCHRNAPIARGGNAFVAHMHHPGAAFRASKRIQNRAGRVRRAVVDEDHFDIRHALGFQTLQTDI